jgi:hypothetical protein
MLMDEMDLANIDLEKLEESLNQKDLQHILVDQLCKVHKVHKEVWLTVEESRTSGQVLSALNATFITLIPKEERVTHPK